MQPNPSLAIAERAIACMRLIVAVPLIAALLASCAATGQLTCSSGQQAMISEALYFGTDKPDGMVTAEDWESFLNDSVTPRFPHGLSVWRAVGQWKSDTGPIVQESSYVLNIVHPDSAAAESALNEVVNAYKTEFRQEAVLRVRSPACVSF
jgi:hypothetical protein